MDIVYLMNWQKGFCLAAKALTEASKNEDQSLTKNPRTVLGLCGGCLAAQPRLELGTKWLTVTYSTIELLGKSLRFTINYFKSEITKEHNNLTVEHYKLISDKFTTFRAAGKTVHCP